jgi:hypothetical protein
VPDLHITAQFAKSTKNLKDESFRKVNQLDSSHLERLWLELKKKLCRQHGTSQALLSLIHARVRLAHACTLIIGVVLLVEMHLRAVSCLSDHIYVGWKHSVYENNLRT